MNKYKYTWCIIVFLHPCIAVAGKLVIYVSPREWNNLNKCVCFFISVFTVTVFPGVLGILFHFFCCCNKCIWLYYWCLGASLSKQPAAAYCPLLHDKIRTKRKCSNPVCMAQGCWDLMKGFHGLAGIQRPSFFSCYHWGFIFFALAFN